MNMEAKSNNIKCFEFGLTLLPHGILVSRAPLWLLLYQYTNQGIDYTVYDLEGQIFEMTKDTSERIRYSLDLWWLWKYYKSCHLHFHIIVLARWRA